MRVRGTSKRAIISTSLLFLAGLMSMIWMLASGNTVPTANQGEELFLVCDAEHIEDRDNALKFIAGDFVLNNGHTQREKMSRSGKFSSVANTENRYAISLKLKVKGGERYRARLWRYNIHGAGTLVTQGSWSYSRSTSDAFEVEPSGWEHLELTVRVPDTVKNGVLTVFGWYPHFWEDEVYFDDLEIWRIFDPAPVCNTEKRDSLWEIAESGVHIHPFTELETADSQVVSILSYYSKPIEILGSGPASGMTDMLAQPAVIPPYKNKITPGSATVLLKPGNEYVFFRVSGRDGIFREKIHLWKMPEYSSPYQELLHKGTPAESEFYDIQGDTLVFRKGFHTVKETIFITAGYQVQFEPGVRLDFVESAKFICFSPTSLLGTPENPIEIVSSDETAQGFSVIGGGKCEARYVSFTGFNTLMENGWSLSSAVTFYECDVRLDHVTVTGNKCEDALNLVRSTFDITDLEISRTFADGFDADFCTGTIRNSRFKNTGNDGMDFSGSEITIIDCVVDHPGDKGLSVGEQSTVWVKGDLSVNDAPIGVASKDKSVLNIENSSLINCEVGFAAYQKKPEFGPGTIHAKNIRLEGNSLNYQLSNGSILVLDGNSIR